MNFSFIGSPHSKFKRVNAVPFSCIRLIKQFASPQVLISPSVDIIHQCKVIGGVKVRSIIYDVRESVELSFSSSKPRLMIQSMIYGDFSYDIGSVGRIELDQSTFALLHIDSRSSSTYLMPGTYNTLNIEFSQDVVQEYSRNHIVVKKWLENFNEGKCYLYGQKLEIDSLKELQVQLVDTNINSKVKEKLFRLKLNECFIRLIDSQRP